MTDVGEKVAKFIAADENKIKCTYEPDDKKWKADLAGTGKKLGNSLGNKPDAIFKKDLSNKSFPSQAHHLIPTSTLNPNAKGAEDNPLHDVHLLLAKGDVLYADTDYDINNKNNGKWMPYAHRLKEWIPKSEEASRTAGLTKDAAKNIKAQILVTNTELMTLVMEKSNIQIHQGPHSTEKYGQGESGYLTRVDLYLDKIKNKAASHFAGKRKCTECCKKAKANANLFPPRANTVRYVDKVSSFIEADINNCRIFVSEAASKFHEDFGFIKEENQ
jgi:hypothetical protein